MANSAKREAIAKLDPNRFELAKSMAVVPGGPMNNDPQNVTSVGFMPGSMSGVNKFPYGDSGLANSPKMGGVYPMQNSGVPQNQVRGLRNNALAYGTQPQPLKEAADPLESSRLGIEAQRRGLNASPMGALGMPAMPAPGGSVPSRQQTPRTLPLQGAQTAEVQPERKGKGMNTKTGQRSA